MSNQSVSGPFPFLLPDLRPHPDNPRQHPKKQVLKLAKAVKKCFINPIIADETGMILAGHGRYEAAKIAGLATVPVIIVSGMSEAEKLSYVLSDNRLGDESNGLWPAAHSPNFNIEDHRLEQFSPN